MYGVPEFPRVLLAVTAIIIGVTGCEGTPKKTSFLRTFEPLPCCCEVSITQDVDCEDVLMTFSPELRMYERQPNSTWAKSTVDTAKLPHAVQGKRVLLAVKPDTSATQLAEYCRNALLSEISFLCATKEGYRSLRFADPVVLGASGTSMVEIIFMFEQKESESVRQSMRDSAKMKEAALYSDGTCLLFYIEQHKTSNTWKINGVTMTESMLLIELQDFDKWRRENRLPPIACIFAPDENATVQEVVSKIATLHRVGIKRIRIGGIRLK